MSDLRDFCPLWDEWEPDTRLGSGSFGSVWKMRRDTLGRMTYYAAVKHISIPRDEDEVSHLMDEGVLTDRESAVRFYDQRLNDLLSEIDAMHQLQGYTNIVSYEDHKIVPKPDGIGYDLFLRMELLTPLTVRMKYPMKIRDVLDLGVDIATAIEVLQDHHMIHRDIKPQNIFINDMEKYKLGDYGTARALETGAEAMSRKGTFNYMAPEVYNSQGTDIRADIYSLGIVLYRLLNANRLPFQPMEGPISSREADDALLKRITGQTAAPPKHADRQLGAIILKAIAFRPEDRYQNASDFRKALENYRERMNQAQTASTGNTIPTQTEWADESSRNGRGSSVSRKPYAEQTGEQSRAAGTVQSAPQAPAQPSPQTEHAQPAGPGKKQKSKKPLLIGTAAAAAVILLVVLLLPKKPGPSDETNNTASLQTRTETAAPVTAAPETEAPVTAAPETEAPVTAAPETAQPEPTAASEWLRAQLAGGDSTETATPEAGDLSGSLREEIMNQSGNGDSGNSLAAIVASANNPDQSGVQTAGTAGLQPDLRYGSGELKEQYEYDSSGRLKKISYYTKNGTLERTRTNLAFDARNNPTEYIYEFESEGEQKRNRFMAEYDENNRLITERITDRQGESLGSNHYTYDSQGRLVYTVSYDGKGKTKYSRKDYRYDSDDHLLGYMEYDAQGQLTVTVEQKWQDGVLRSVRRIYPEDEYGAFEAADYFDPNGDYTSGRTIGTNKDGSKYISQYDENGVRTREENYTADGTKESYTLFKYDSSGNEISSTRYGADDSVQAYTTVEYSSDHKVREVTTEYDSGAMTGQLETEYDTRGNRTSFTSKTAGGDVRYRFTYSYDSDNKLTYSELHDYDETTHRLNFTSKTTYDDQERAVRVLYLDADGYPDHGYNYRYDDQGNKFSQHFTYKNGQLQEEEWQRAD